MLALVIHVLMGNAKINEVYLLLEIWVPFEVADHDVVWFDVAVNVSLLMKLLQELDHLQGEVNNAYL